MLLDLNETETRLFMSQTCIAIYYAIHTHFHSPCRRIPAKVAFALLVYLSFKYTIYTIICYLSWIFGECTFFWQLLVASLPYPSNWPLDKISNYLLSSILCRQAAGKMSAREMLEELMSIKELYNDARSCPKCRMTISKTEGCNKVVCISCGQSFCFLCGKAIIAGYAHFR